MLNLFSFFKQQASDFRRENKHRSADYLAGGADALREAGDTLTSHKDVVDLEWVTNQLNAQEKEGRELRTLNKAFDESRRTFQSRCDLQAKEIARLKEQLANWQAAPAVPHGQQGQLQVLRTEAGNLRQRVKQLEDQMRAVGHQPPPDVANLQNTIMLLRQELDKEKGISRVGRHTATLAQVLKSLRRVMKYEDKPAESRLQYVRNVIDTAEDVMQGREPKELAHTTEPSLLPA